MVEEILESRLMVKKSMKRYKDDAVSSSITSQLKPTMIELCLVPWSRTQTRFLL